MNWLKRLWHRLMTSASLRALERQASAAIEAAAEPPGRLVMKIDTAALVRAFQRPAGIDRGRALLELFPVAMPPPGSPAEVMTVKLSLDESMASLYGTATLGQFSDDIGFLGFPFLAQLTQRPEYRMITETRAKEMTRKWIELEYTGEDGDQSEKLDKISKALDRFKVRETFREAAEHDGFFGRAQIYIDTGSTDNPAELRKPLLINKAKIKQGDLKAFRLVEPIWTYPNAYNASDPLRADYFRPTSWFVQGKLLDRSRLLVMISRPVPDLLKANYAFGGLSLSQMAKPYIDNWLRTRQSVSDLLHSFSIVVLMTNMAAVLGGAGGEDVFRRVDIFNATRDNRGTFMVDKDQEDIKNLAVPLGTLDKLQAQSQEQMASVSQTPLVKLLGITPSGLNASSDGEIRVFYDMINAMQEHIFREPLKKVIDLIQLNEFGVIDDKVTFKFVPLWQLDEAAESTVRKSDMDSDVEAVNAGILAPEEVRKRLANDPKSPYAGLDVSDVPEPPDMGDDPDILDNPAKTAEPKKTEASGDAAFVESEHPRDPVGKFAAGGGSSGGTEGGGAPARPPFDPAEVAKLPREAAQPASSWEDIKAKGETAHAEFSAALGKVASKLGLKRDVATPEELTEAHAADPHGYLFVAPNKSEARARQKVDNDYRGDWSRLRDFVRASIAVGSMAELRAAIAAVEEAGLPLAQKPKDKFSAPSAEGYRDLNTVVKLPSGMVAEIQYHLKPIIKAKEAAHTHYVEQQNLVRKNGTEEPSEAWSEQETRKFTDLRAAQRAIYDPIWERVGG